LDQSDETEIKDIIIRHEAGLSSLSNLDLEGDTLSEYDRLLDQEREKLIKFLKNEAREARMDVIISPYGSYIEKPRNQKRLSKLLKFLEERSKESRRCKFVVSKQMRLNLLFLGECFLFEGYKPSKGYEWTVIHSDKNYIEARIKIFDEYFDSVYKSNLEEIGLTGKEPDVEERLREFVIRKIREAIKSIDDIDNKEKSVIKDDNTDQ
jgi:hypothetical protein